MHPSIKILRTIVDGIYLSEHRELGEDDYTGIMEAIEKIEKYPHLNEKQTGVMRDINQLKVLATQKTIYTVQDGTNQNVPACGMTWEPNRNQWWLVFDGEINYWSNQLPHEIIDALKTGLQVTWT